ncbi:contact-dependent growth inhibition system immunity protein [Streptomyces sp. NPDC002092]
MEDDRWRPPAYDSYLVTTVHALRRKPIGALTVADLGLLIRQNIGLPHLHGGLLSAVLTGRTPRGEMPVTVRELRSIVSTLTGLDSWLRERAEAYLDVVADS